MNQSLEDMSSKEDDSSEEDEWSEFLWFEIDLNVLFDNNAEESLYKSSGTTTCRSIVVGSSN